MISSTTLKSPVDKVCHCGRKVMPPHCPMCGSGNIYAKRANDYRIYDRDSDQEISFAGFKCRRCHLDFHDGMTCEAPLLQSMKDKRQLDEAKEKLQNALDSVGGDRQALIRKLVDGSQGNNYKD